MLRDMQSTTSAGADVTYGDKITIGNITDSYTAIGNGAQVIVNQIQEAHSAIKELEKGIQTAERYLADEIRKKVMRYTELPANIQVDDRSNPYKALLDYKLEDVPFFYGREEATTAMLEKLSRNPLTILHADSGSGKTSLLQAGLASRLLAQGLFPLYLRPYKQAPGQFIKKAFLSDYETLDELKRFRDEQMSLRGFLERVAHYLGKRSLFLFLDQFEEFFTELKSEEQQTFAEQLRECVESDLEVRWVLSLRKEYFSDLRLFNTLKPFENEYFLPTFKLEEAKEVIIEPAARKNVRYEPGLMDEILADIFQEGQGIPPAQVQLVCYTLFEELQQEADPHLITRALYQKPRGRGGSGAEGILTHHLTNVLNNKMSAPERQMASRVLESLVTSQKRRAVKSRPTLLDELKPDPPEILDDVLTILIENRLLRTDENDADEALYELTHDYLLAEIELDAETQARKAAQELLAQETAAFKVYGTLLSADKFGIINSCRQFLVVNEAEKELLDLSQAARRRDLMKQVGAIGAAVLLIIGTLVAALIIQRDSNTKIARSATQVANSAAAAATGEAKAINAQISAEFDRATAEAASTVAIEQQATAEAERAEAERQTNIALSRQLAAESLNVLGTDPERAIQLAMEAIRASKTREEAVIPEAINALHRAVQSSRVQTVIKAYDTIVFDVSYSLDGKYLASGGFDGNVYIWDLETANPPLALSRDSISLTGAKINKDGTLIFLSDIKGNVEVWDLATKQLLPGYPKSLHKEAAIIDVDLTQDGSLLATTGSDSTTRITDATTGEIIQQIPLDGIGCGVAFNADGSQVVTGDINGSIYLWDLEKEQEIRQFTHASEHQEACAVALSPDNQLLATGGADMITKLWSQETGELLSTLAQHTDTIFRITFSPDGKLLASAGFDNKANIYDVASGKLLQTLAGHKGRLRALAFAPDGSQLVSADEAGEIRFWDVSFGYHSGAIGKVLFSPAGDFLASGSADGTIKVWEPESENLLEQIDIGGRVWDIDIHPSQSLIAVVGDNNLAQVWDVVTNKQVLKFPVKAASSGSIAYSPDGQLLAVAGDEGVLLWDVSSQDRVGFFSTPQQNYSVAFSPDGKSLAVVTADSIVRVWDLTTNELKFTLTHEPDREIFKVAFSPQGNLLATAGVDGRVKLWDAANGEILTELVGHTKSVYDVKFSPNGKLLATASAKPSVEVWNVTLAAANPKLPYRILEFQDFDQYVASVGFSPDGRQVVAAGADQVIRQYTLSLADLIEQVEQRSIQLEKNSYIRKEILDASKF